MSCARPLFGFALVASSLFCASARAEEGRHPALRHDVAIGVPVIGVSLVAHGLSEFALKSALGPTSCAWCDRDENGNDTLNPFDRGARSTLVWSDTRTPNTLSFFTAALAPIAGTALNVVAARSEGESWETVGVDALVVAEVVAVSLATNQLVKFVIARERPFVHARSPDERKRNAHNDDNLSFYSGHTKLAFAAATAAGTVASMRHYSLAPVTWTTGGALSASTGWLRIAADKHYLSDVLVGALLGIAYGTLIPYVFHRPTGGRMTGSGPAPTTAPASFAFAVAF